MNKKTLIKYLLAAVVLIILSWIIWPGKNSGKGAETDSIQKESKQAAQGVLGKESELKSAILPITRLDMVSGESINGVTEEIKGRIQQQFSQASKYLSQQDLDKASEQLQEIIDENPLVVEPYINLAAVYAKDKRLEDAQKVLLDGLKANASYQLLFNNLQKIHGAMAANAYSKALNGSESVESLDLSLSDRVSFAPISKRQTQKLESQFSQLQERLKQSESKQNDELTKVKQILSAKTKQLKHAMLLISQEKKKREKLALKSQKTQQVEQKKVDKQKALALKLFEQESLKTKEMNDAQLAAIKSESKASIAALTAKNEQVLAQALAEKELEANSAITKLEQERKAQLEQITLQSKQDLALKEKEAQAVIAELKKQNEKTVAQLIAVKEQEAKTTIAQLEQEKQAQLAELRKQSQEALSKALAAKQRDADLALAKLEKEKENELAKVLANKEAEMKETVARLELESKAQYAKQQQAHKAQLSKVVAAKQSELNQAVASIEEQKRVDLQKAALSLELAKKEAEKQAAAAALALINVKPTVNKPAVTKPIETIKPVSKPTVVAVAPKPKAVNKSGISDEQKATAINLAKSWALAWSEQNVASYIDHYVADYSPAYKGLTNAQWRKQRQQRLSNKSFIKVDVSAFSVNAKGNGFSVVFTQNYKSNSLDDTIRKRLVFKIDNGDWSKAKISNEVVLN